MKDHLDAALLLIGAVSLANLALTVLLVRWSARRGPGPGGGRADDERLWLDPGEAIGPFEQVATTGEVLDLAAVRDRLRVVAFVSPSCEPCHDELPRLLAAAAEAPRETTLIVVLSDGERAEAVADLVGAIERVAVCAVAGLASSLARAFAVRAYPAVFLVGRGGVVEQSGTSVRGRHPVGAA